MRCAPPCGEISRCFLVPCYHEGSATNHKRYRDRAIRRRLAQKRCGRCRIRDDQARRRGRRRNAHGALPPRPQAVSASGRPPVSQKAARRRSQQVRARLATHAAPGRGSAHVSLRAGSACRASDPLLWFIRSLWLTARAGAVAHSHRADCSSRSIGKAAIARSSSERLASAYTIASSVARYVSYCSDAAISTPVRNRSRLRGARAFAKRGPSRRHDVRDAF